MNAELNSQEGSKFGMQEASGIGLNHSSGTCRVPDPRQDNKPQFPSFSPHPMYYKNVAQYTKKQATKERIHSSW